MITCNETTIQTVHFNGISADTLHFNGVLVYDFEDVVAPISLRLQPISLYASTANTMEMSNELATALLLVHTSNEEYVSGITVTSAVTKSTLSPSPNFKKSPLVHISGGTYLMTIRKAAGYTGGSNWGLNTMKLTFSADTLDHVYSAQTSTARQWDHSAVPRIKKNYTETYFVPKEGTQALSGTMYGLAYDVAEISGLTTYKYDRSNEKKVYKEYVVNGQTVYPQNAAQMATANVTLDYKLSTIKFNVSENQLPVPRIGWLRLCTGNTEYLKWFFVQDSENMKFLFFGGFTAGAYENIGMIDISKTGETLVITATTNNFSVFNGFTDRIRVTNSNGSELTPTTTYGLGMTFKNYKTLVGTSPYVFNIEVL